ESIEKHKEYMNHLFNQFQLQSLDGWLNIKRGKITMNGGYGIVKYYNNDMKNILSSIYPNYPWNFSSLLSIQLKRRKFKSIEKHKEVMNHLFYQFQLNSLDDWLNITRNKMITKGGYGIVKYYKYDMKNI